MPVNKKRPSEIEKEQKKGKVSQLLNPDVNVELQSTDYHFKTQLPSIIKILPGYLADGRFQASRYSDDLSEFNFHAQAKVLKYAGTTEYKDNAEGGAGSNGPPRLSCVLAESDGYGYEHPYNLLMSHRPRQQSNRRHVDIVGDITGKKFNTSVWDRLFGYKKPFPYVQDRFFVRVVFYRVGGETLLDNELCPYGARSGDPTIVSDFSKKFIKDLEELANLPNKSPKGGELADLFQLGDFVSIAEGKIIVPRSSKQVLDMCPSDDDEGIYMESKETAAEEQQIPPYIVYAFDDVKLRVGKRERVINQSLEKWEDNLKENHVDVNMAIADPVSPEEFCERLVNACPSTENYPYMEDFFAFAWDSHREYLSDSVIGLLKDRTQVFIPEGAQDEGDEDEEEEIPRPKRRRRPPQEAVYEDDDVEEDDEVVEDNADVDYIPAPARSRAAKAARKKASTGAPAPVKKKRKKSASDVYGKAAREATDVKALVPRKKKKKRPSR